MRKSVYNSICHCLKENDIIILDGFPRFIEQAIWLDDNIGDMADIYYVLIHAPSWILRDRAKKRDRPDDSNFEKRLEYYRNVTYKELYDNELIRKAFFNDKGEFKKVRQGDKNIPVVLHPTISVALFHSPDNFNTEQKKTIGEYIMQKLGKSEKADGKDFARATQLLSSITWKYAGDREAWAKQVKQAKNNTTNESILVNLKENKMYSETVKLTQKYNTNLSERARKLGYNKDYIKLTEDWINKNGLN